MSKEANSKELSLHELLSRKTIPVLRDIARNLKLKGCSGERKNVLLERIQEALLSAERFRNLLYIIDSSAWKCILEASAASSPVPVNPSGEKPCKVIADLGYLQWMEADSRKRILMPAEIKSMFQQLAEDGFVEEKERADLLDSYALAAVNLYGVISQDDFVSLFNQQNEQKTDIDEIFSVLIQHISADAPYCFWDEYITHFLFEENEFADAENLVQITAGKPRYIPEKEIFLKYAQPDDYSENHAAVRLEKFLAPHLKISAVSAKEVVSELVFACSVDADIGHIMSILQEYHFHFDETDGLKAAQLIADLSFNTRKWSNKGYTSKELRQTASSSAEKRTKVGRNDPCPCGSGKKYKKCCGR